MEFLEALSKIWPMILTFIGVVAWFIRLEVTVSFQKEANTALKSEIETIKKEASKQKDVNQEKFDDIHDMFMGIKEQLARIEGSILSRQSKDIN